MEPVSGSREPEFLNTMVRDLSTIGRGFVKSLHIVGQLSPIMRADETFSFQADKTKQPSSQRHKGKTVPADKNQRINPARVTAGYTQWLISAGKNMLVINTTMDYKSIKNQNSDPTSFCTVFCHMALYLKYWPFK